MKVRSHQGCGNLIYFRLVPAPDLYEGFADEPFSRESLSEWLTFAGLSQQGMFTLVLRQRPLIQDCREYDARAALPTKIDSQTHPLAEGVCPRWRYRPCWYTEPALGRRER
jgi:hypothetical protein